MRSNTLLGNLLVSTYEASGTGEPMERYYATMFARYFDLTGKQSGCAAVRAILRGNPPALRGLRCCYQDPKNPRCPELLQTDLEALADCCFPDGIRRSRLRQALQDCLSQIPEADVRDMEPLFVGGDLILMWACLTWYALCEG